MPKYFTIGEREDAKAHKHGECMSVQRFLKGNTPNNLHSLTAAEYESKEKCKTCE